METANTPAASLSGRPADRRSRSRRSITSAKRPWRSRLSSSASSASSASASRRGGTRMPRHRRPRPRRNPQRPATRSEPGRDTCRQPPRARLPAKAGRPPRAPWQVAAQPTTVGTRTAARQAEVVGKASGAVRASVERPATISRLSMGCRVLCVRVVHERLVRGTPEKRGQLRGRAITVERAERELGGSWHPPDVRQPALKRMPGANSPDRSVAMTASHGTMVPRSRT